MYLRKIVEVRWKWNQRVTSRKIRTVGEVDIRYKRKRLKMTFAKTRC